MPTVNEQRAPSPNSLGQLSPGRGSLKGQPSRFPGGGSMAVPPVPPGSPGVPPPTPWSVDAGSLQESAATSAASSARRRASRMGGTREGGGRLTSGGGAVGGLLDVRDEGG